jgi:hypothetical protein
MDSNHLLLSTHAVIKASLYSQISDEHYLIIHTLRGAIAHSCCLAGGVASLLLPYSEVEALMLIHMQCGRSHGAAVHLTASSSLQSLLD